MPLGNNRGSRTGKLVMSSTPMGNGWVSVSGSMYQKNQKDETDPKGKLVIENYNRDITSAVFYGWDLIMADELENSYVFQLIKRENSKLRVYITLGRELQTADREHNNDLMYQCYIHDDAGEWAVTTWFYTKDLTYINFWTQVEEIVDKYHPILPF